MRPGNKLSTMGVKMASDIIVPEDVRQMIDDILANKEKERKEQEEREGDLDRLYIEDFIPEPEEKEPVKEVPIEERWKIEYSFILQKLVKVANYLDGQDLIDEANQVDSIIKKAIDWKHLPGKIMNDVQDFFESKKCSCTCSACTKGNDDPDKHRDAHYNCDTGKCEIKKKDLDGTSENSVSGIRG